MKIKQLNLNTWWNTYDIWSREKIRLIELYRYDISQIFSNTYENQPKKGVNCSISGPQWRHFWNLNPKKFKIYIYVYITMCITTKNTNKWYKFEITLKICWLQLSLPEVEMILEQALLAMFVKNVCLNWI